MTIRDMNIQSVTLVELGSDNWTVKVRSIEVHRTKTVDGSKFRIQKYAESR